MIFFFPWAVAPCNGLQWEPKMLTLARAVCGTQGSARDEAQPACIRLRCFRIISLHQACSSWCFPSLFYGCGGRRKANERDITEIGQVRSRHIKMKEYRSVRLYGSSSQQASCQDFPGDCPLLPTLHCGANASPPLQLLSTPL